MAQRFKKLEKANNYIAGHLKILNTMSLAREQVSPILPGAPIPAGALKTCEQIPPIPPAQMVIPKAIYSSIFKPVEEQKPARKEEPLLLLTWPGFN